MTDQTSESAKTSKNFLNIQQTVQVADWLRSHPDEVAHTKSKTLAKAIANDLGFPITERNLRTVADHLSIKLCYGQPRPSADRSRRLTEFESRIEKLELLLEHIQRRLDKLHSDLYGSDNQPPQPQQP